MITPPPSGQKKKEGKNARCRELCQGATTRDHLWSVQRPANSDYLSRAIVRAPAVALLLVLAVGEIADLKLRLRYDDCNPDFLSSFRGRNSRDNHTPSRRNQAEKFADGISSILDSISTVRYL